MATASARDLDASASPGLADAQEPGGPYAETKTASTPGLELARVTLWHEPSAAHPRGTVLALGYTKESVPWFVEVDIATTATIARYPIDAPPHNRIELSRVGDSLHAVILGDQALVWATWDLALSAPRRVVLPGMAQTFGADRGYDRYSGFGVVGADVVVAGHNGISYVFDERGKRLATYDCAPFSFGAQTQATVLSVGALVVIAGFVHKEREGLCAFRLDRPGTSTATYGRDEGEPAYFAGALYLMSRRIGTPPEDAQLDFRKLGDDLRPIETPVADPRPRLPLARCRVTGDIVHEDVWAWGVDVVLTGWCCGGDPGGLFFCAPEGPDPRPPTGSPGYYVAPR
jgi:hypothetical protein